ncbi:MAG TPA: hypothetical protein VGL75_13075 [Acidothermaceae bacterium]
MVANDGRESLRGLLNKAGKSTDDAAVSDFKVIVARHLGTTCTAMLIDLMYGREALDELRGAAPDTGRIVAVDLFDEPRFGPLASTTLDHDAIEAAAQFDDVHALKFFSFWHPDQPKAKRVDESAEFVERCAQLGVLSLLEGVVQLPVTDPRFDDSLLAAGAEYGQAMPDLYKTQVPSIGTRPLEDVQSMSADLSREVGTPWVALSNGIAADNFADVVSAVCRGGASGFLAGRASWSPAISADDPETELETIGRTRLASYVERVDRDAVPWWIAAGEPPQGAVTTGETGA